MLHSFFPVLLLLLRCYFIGVIVTRCFFCFFVFFGVLFFMLGSWFPPDRGLLQHGAVVGTPEHHHRIQRNAHVVGYREGHLRFVGVHGEGHRACHTVQVARHQRRPLRQRSRVPRPTLHAVPVVADLAAVAAHKVRGAATRSLRRQPDEHVPVSRRVQRHDDGPAATPSCLRAHRRRPDQDVAARRRARHRRLAVVRRDAHAAAELAVPRQPRKRVAERRRQAWETLLLLLLLLLRSGGGGGSAARTRHTRQRVAQLAHGGAEHAAFLRQRRHALQRALVLIALRRPPRRPSSRGVLLPASDPAAAQHPLLAVRQARRSRERRRRLRAERATRHRVVAERRRVPAVPQRVVAAAARRRHPRARLGHAGLRAAAVRRVRLAHCLQPRQGDVLSERGG
eukprot:Rhum_TRINITY_DN8708_c0_g1::Rhum_TRINITY_DN8708_c0_g1_i1::g.29481::m.29481